MQTTETVLSHRRQGQEETMSLVMTLEETTMASNKSRIIGTVRFNGLEDPVMLNHLMEECRIELWHQESSQVLEVTTPGKDAASNVFKFDFAATTDGPCAVHFPREVRYGGAVARLQAIDLIEFDNKWARRTFDRLDKDRLTLEALEYRVLPGTIRVQFFDYAYKPVTIKADEIQVFSGKSLMPAKSITLNGSWYEVSVPPGPHILVVPEPYSFQSGGRSHPLFVESGTDHVACAISSPPAVTTGAIRFQIVDPDNNPINVPATASISLFQNGAATSVPSPANGLYSVDSVPEGSCTLVLPATFPAPQVDVTPQNSTAIIDQITNITYRLQSPQMQPFPVQAGKTIMLPYAVYQRYGTLMWAVTVHGNPAPGLFVRVLNSDTGQSIGEAVSGSDGIAQIPLKLDAADPATLDVLVYKSGGPEGTPVAQRIPFPGSIPVAETHTTPTKHVVPAPAHPKAAEPAQPVTVAQSVSTAPTHAAVHEAAKV
jgi:hypothetical protein